jgi:hypothetical protein
MSPSTVMMPWTMDMHDAQYSKLSLGNQDKLVLEGEIIRNQKQPKFLVHSVYLSLKCLSMLGLELRKDACTSEFVIICFCTNWKHRFSNRAEELASFTELKLSNCTMIRRKARIAASLHSFENIDDTHQHEAGPSSSHTGVFSSKLTNLMSEPLKPSVSDASLSKSKLKSSWHRCWEKYIWSIDLRAALVGRGM